MIFIDTGAFIARYLEQDQHHRKSLKGWNQIAKANTKCITSNFVLNETFTLLARWANYSFASEKAEIIYSSKSINIIRPELNDELLAINFFRKFADQKVSYTDCISFVIMHKLKIKQVFSFDKHFALAGFKLW